MIKFRAWDKRRKEMWKVATLHIEDEYADLFKTNIYENPFNDPWAKFEDLILMQSTGLQDKNGVEIYEGDIIETSWGTNYSDGYKPVSIYIGTVGFGEYEQDASGGEYGGERCIGFYGEFFVGADDDRDFSKLDSYSYEKQQSLLKFDEIEVLGNIYADPELLSQGIE